VRKDFELTGRFNDLTSVLRKANLLPKHSAGGSWGTLLQVQSKIVSQFLQDWRAGGDEASRALLPLVYDELRRVAHRYPRKERADHTLKSTALVHEAYLRLEKQGSFRFQNRAHWLAVRDQLMGRILVEHARGGNTAKRDGGDRVTLDGLAFKSRSVDMVPLDDAPSELAKLDPLESRIVKFRFFGGLSVEETSDLVKMSPTIVKRRRASARAWLHRQMQRVATP
jgi:RNA polymerase sigma-70 factor, ECF subfamily